MNLKLKEKTDDGTVEKKQQEAPKRSGRSIAELASISTLSEEELEEANENDEDTEDEEYEDGYETEADDIEEPEDEDDESAEEEATEEENDPPMEHYGRVFSFDGKPTPQDVFRFMFYHTYFSVVGVFAILIVLASVVMAVWSFMDEKYTQGIIFAAVFLFFIIFFILLNFFG